MTTTDTAASQRTAALIEGRRADTTRRRERVLAALTQARAAGLEVSVAGIAQAAGVDRTFLYRHRDLLAHVHADQAQPTIPAVADAAWNRHPIDRFVFARKPV